MKTYNFKVVVEPDEDFDGNPSGWHAYCPALEQQGASTWGVTEAEALKNINDVAHMVVESKMWRKHYNTIRPHSALGYRAPAPLTWTTAA